MNKTIFKRVLCYTLCITIFSVLMLTSCSGTKNDSTNADVAELVLINKQTSDYKIVRADDANESITQSIDNLCKKITEQTGTTLAVETDLSEDDTKTVKTENAEILIGKTNRAESIEVLESLPENSYAVTIKNNKLVIIGTDDNLTVLAIYDFVERILGNANRCSAGKLLVSRIDCVKVTRETKFSLADIVRNNYKYLVSYKSMMRCDYTDAEYSIGQGAATDGKYIYFTARNSDETHAIISKYSVEDFSLVKTSEPLALGHANDITYDATNERLVVARGGKQGGVLAAIDPESLEMTENIAIDYGAGAITYNKLRERYAISQGGNHVSILDKDLESGDYYSREKLNPDYRIQGMGSDDDYIYFPMDKRGADNIFEVYDWHGNYVTTITIPIDMESESVFFLDGDCYIPFIYSGSGGVLLYKIDFSIVYE